MLEDRRREMIWRTISSATHVILQHHPQSFISGFSVMCHTWPECMHGRTAVVALLLSHDDLLLGGTGLVAHVRQDGLLHGAHVRVWRGRVVGFMYLCTYVRLNMMIRHYGQHSLIHVKMLTTIDGNKATLPHLQQSIHIYPP